MNSLPSDILREIIRYVPRISLISLLFVSKRIRKVTISICCRKRINSASDLYTYFSWFQVGDEIWNWWINSTIPMAIESRSLTEKFGKHFSQNFKDFRTKWKLDICFAEALALYHAKNGDIRVFRRVKSWFRSRFIKHSCIRECASYLRKNDLEKFIFFLFKQEGVHVRSCPRCRLTDLSSEENEVYKKMLEFDKKQSDRKFNAAEEKHQRTIISKYHQFLHISSP